MWNQPFLTQLGSPMSFTTREVGDLHDSFIDFGLGIEAKQIYESLQAGLFDMTSDAHGITVIPAILCWEVGGC